MGLYAFNTYKSENKIKNIDSISLLHSEINEISEGIRKGEIIARYTCIARDWVNEQSDVLTPQEFARRTEKLCEKNNISCNVFGKERIQKENMNALLAVNQGSAYDPVFLVLEYLPVTGAPTVLVGKGVTFDSGGLQIKEDHAMLGMHGDMAGAAAVVTALNALAELKVKQNIVALIPLTENMPDGRSFKPGAIIRARNGVTIEIGHTDAEGRLILADALSYASFFKPKAIIDLATLTGACIIALGFEAAGLWSNNKNISGKIVLAGETTGDRAWPMPLYKEYDEYIESEIADIKNVGLPKSRAGACTAAAFLKRFVPENTPWAHLDIAGTALLEKSKPYAFPLGSGAGVRLLVEYFTQDTRTKQ